MTLRLGLGGQVESAQLQHLPALPALPHLLPVLDALVVVVGLLRVGRGHRVYEVLQAGGERPLLLVGEAVVQRVVDGGSEISYGQALRAEEAANSNLFSPDWIGIFTGAKSVKLYMISTLALLQIFGHC